MSAPCLKCLFQRALGGRRGSEGRGGRGGAGRCLLPRNCDVNRRCFLFQASHRYLYSHFKMILARATKRSFSRSNRQLKANRKHCTFCSKKIAIQKPVSAIPIPFLSNVYVSYVRFQDMVNDSYTKSPRLVPLSVCLLIDAYSMNFG